MPCPTIHRDFVVEELQDFLDVLFQGGQVALAALEDGDLVVPAALRLLVYGQVVEIVAADEVGQLPGRSGRVCAVGVGSGGGRCPELVRSAWTGG